MRAALGASRGNILALVMRQGMTLTGLGAAIGVAAAAAATQAIVALLFGVSHLDPATYLGVIAMLAAAAMMACGVPAWRAARVDPARTRIVEGAVGMVDMALELLSKKDIVHLDEERKAAMVSNLLVVLCGERGAQPILNTGTIYQ